MGRFQIRERSKTGRAETEYVVVDTQHDDLPLAEFDERSAAEAHVRKLEEGPFDWDEQEQWKDDWEDDWDDG